MCDHHGHWLSRLSSISAPVCLGPVHFCTQYGFQTEWKKHTEHGGGLHTSPPHVAEHTFPGCSQRLHSAFSFERLMGFTLLSDTCWKCNCAHNCCVGMEAGLFPKAGASLRKQQACFLQSCWWSMWLAFPDLFWAAGQED